MNRFLILCSMFLLTACSPSPKAAPVARNHPANPDAPTAARPTPLAHDDADGHNNTGHNDAMPASPAAKYVCPMHPAITSSDPNARCPECGMKINKPVTPTTQENPK